MTNTAILYNGFGTYQSSVSAWQKVLTQRGYKTLQRAGKDFAIAVHCHPHSLVVIPGGHSRFFKQDLGESGAEALKTHVHAGGLTLAVCGGLYYLTRNIRFVIQRDGVDEILQNTGIECIAADSFNQEAYQSSGAGTASFVPLQTKDGLVYTYYNGGPRIKYDKEHLPFALARFQDDYEAVMSLAIGRGMVIGLSVHPEFSMENLPDSLQGAVLTEEEQCLKTRLMRIEGDHKTLLNRIFDLVETKQRRLAQGLHLT
ncbi:MAG: hypothetical protein CMH30_08225 [Micavibrio sp.]|nr:hypothetical protein [Micavibrio sp.]|tara:strand:- start:1297 stop:2067 length:771 start_codon:yes stop_codon:yes gene_type:complete